MVQTNPNLQYEIHTPFGWQTFSGIQKLIKPEMVELNFKEVEFTFKCSPNHPLRMPSGEIVKAGDLIEGDILEHENFDFVTIKSITFIEGDVVLYDILDAGKEKLFYSDGLVSHNCEFIGSSNTLIDHNKLTVMTGIWRTPVVQTVMPFSQFPDGTESKLDVHVEPLSGHQYVLCADVAGGKELDSSAFVVFDITTMPYTVVAKYKSDKISTMLYPDVIASAATKYNMAYVLVETNDNDVAKTLQLDLEYENLITTTSKGKGTQVGGGFTKNVEFGIRSNKATKRTGCWNLKTLIEADKLIIEDYHIIVELTQFVSNSRNSYSAEEGKHDDLVMCLVNFGWLVNQKYFKELTDMDVYSQLKIDYNAAVDDDLLPFGFISTSVDDMDTDWGPKL